MGTAAVLCGLLFAAACSAPGPARQASSEPPACRPGSYCLHVNLANALSYPVREVTPAEPQRQNGCFTFKTGDITSYAAKLYVNVKGEQWGFWAVVNYYQGPGRYPSQNLIQFFRPDYSRSFTGDGSISVAGDGRSGTVTATLADTVAPAKSPALVLTGSFGCASLSAS